MCNQEEPAMVVAWSVQRQLQLRLSASHGSLPAPHISFWIFLSKEFRNYVVEFCMFSIVSDIFGSVPTRLDLLGRIRLHSDALRCAPMLLTI